jgi:hypothetical protein
MLEDPPPGGSISFSLTIDALAPRAGSLEDAHVTTSFGAHGMILRQSPKTGNVRRLPLMEKHQGRG